MPSAIHTSRSGYHIPEHPPHKSNLSNLSKKQAYSSLNLSETSVATPTHGLRAQINHLLPRHAYFRARIHISQISSVPFVSGEFGVRWKFKGVHSPPAAKHGLLGLVKRCSQKEKGEDPLSLGVAEVDEHGSLAPSAKRSASLASSITSSSSSVPTLDDTSRNTSLSTSSSQFLSADHSIYSTSEGNVSHSTLSRVAQAFNSSTDVSSPMIEGDLSPARGMTSFIKLKDHAVMWNHTLSTVLKCDVERDTLSLLPCPLKLVVMQRVIPDDPNGTPQNPRLGAVYLNLAEYVSEGSVERRYLLRESKTNATLKLTIEMEHVGGETQYIPPPLPKGEILNGLASFLENDIYRRRPRALDLYGPYNDQEELEIDLLGQTKANREAKRRHSGAEDDTDDDGNNVAFDVHRLPLAYGPKTTETLIEALFNPVKTSEKRNESPFTYYVPRGQTRAKSAGTSGLRAAGLSVNVELDGDANATRRHTSLQEKMPAAAEVASVYSTESSGASVDTSSSSSKAGSMMGSDQSSIGQDRLHHHNVGGVKGWWRKVASPRPGTPTQRV